MAALAGAGAAPHLSEERGQRARRQSRGEAIRARCGNRGLDRMFHLIIIKTVGRRGGEKMGLAKRRRGWPAPAYSLTLKCI
jgi:hypothetical protein